MVLKTKDVRAFFGRGSRVTDLARLILSLVFRSYRHAYRTI